MRALAASPLKSAMSVACGVNDPIRNIISQRLQAKDAKETVTIGPVGKIITPATSCSEPRQSTAHVQFTPSFLGGSQLHHTEGDAFEHTIADLPEDRAGEHALSLRLCNVHLKQQPLLLTVSVGGSAGSNTGGMVEGDDVVDVLSIVVPYTVGEWQWTDPVTILLSPGTNVFSFSRETPNFGLSIKDVTCTPIECWSLLESKSSWSILTNNEQSESNELFKKGGFRLFCHFFYFADRYGCIKYTAPLRSIQTTSGFSARLSSSLAGNVTLMMLLS